MVAKVTILALDELQRTDIYNSFQKSLGAGLAVGLFADVPSYRFMRLRSTNVFGHGRKMNMRTYRLCPSATGNQRDKFEEAWSKAET